MTKKHRPTKSRARAFRELEYIVFRNVFVLANIITFSVVALLFIFRDFRAGIFLGIILILNITAGLVQEIRAWAGLEKLQLLTALRFTLVDMGGSEEMIYAEDIRVGNHLKLRLGDQIPCDGVFLSVRNLEVNEALITGESDSFAIKEGGEVSAGSIITAGSGILRADKIFEESRISRMTEGIKRYSVNISEIQQAINTFVKIAGYVLLAALVIAIVRGVLTGDSAVHIVKIVGALSSMLIPQGLVFGATLSFAYGAAHLYRRNILLQEVNATEKLGRIKNLCMDKTGTLTENTLSVREMKVFDGMSEETAKSLASAYIDGTQDSSQTILAIRKFLPGTYQGEIPEALPFSSWRQYGAIRFHDKIKKSTLVVLSGALNIFLPHLKSKEEKEWLKKNMDEHSRRGERALCFVSAEGKMSLRDFSNAKLSVLSLFVFKSNLRKGIHEAIQFFQDRGVSIRIISGDDADTVKAVAGEAGVRHSSMAVTGEEMDAWNFSDYKMRVKDIAIFARVKPEQKEKIIEALREDGFTAMVGDGANDALAIKKADLGIAMFDGATATRQLSAVVLMNNSFLALPSGVRLADNVIRNIELFGSLFFNQVAVGLFLFVFLSIFGYSYPLTPFNITFINYFTIGIPGLLIAYWTVRPPKKMAAENSEPFLRKVAPFAFACALVSSIGLVIAFFLSPQSMKIAGSNMVVVFEFVLLCFFFFVLAPKVYLGTVTREQKMTILGLALCEALLFLVILRIPFLVSFFDISALSLTNIFDAFCIACVCGFFQYEIAGRFVSRGK